MKGTHVKRSKKKNAPSNHTRKLKGGMGAPYHCAGKRKAGRTNKPIGPKAKQQTRYNTKIAKTGRNRGRATVRQTRPSGQRQR